MKKGARHQGESRLRIAASMKGRRNALGNEGGRPLKYKPEYARQVYHLCLLGCIDKELAEFFEISIRTLNNWKRLYPDFWKGLCRGKIIADAEVANALYRLACGYEYVEEKIWVLHDANGQQVIHRMHVTKHLPPNIMAIKFWLTNRAPHLWSHNPKQINIRNNVVHVRRELASGEIVIEDQETYTRRFNQNVDVFLRHRQNESYGLPIQVGTDAQ